MPHCDCSSPCFCLNGRPWKKDAAGDYVLDHERIAANPDPYPPTAPRNTRRTPLADQMREGDDGDATPDLDALLGQ